MKKILFALLFTYGTIAFAAPPPVFTITLDSPLPPPYISPGKTATVSYLVTNTTPYELKSNGLRYQPGGQTPKGVTQQTSGINACANPFTLKAGESCILYLLLTSDNFVDGVAKGGPEVCNTKAHPSHCSVPKTSEQISSTATYLASLAVGQSLISNFPFFIESYNLGRSWKVGSLPSGLASNSAFNSTDCNANLCAIAGNDPPELIFSTNNASTWSLVDTTGFKGASQVACTPGLLGMCFLSGNNANGDAIAIQYTRDTPSWNETVILAAPGSTYSFSMTGTSCGMDLCVTSSTLFNSNPMNVPYNPVLFQIQNPGDSSSSWELVIPDNMDPPTFSKLNGVSCDGGLCVAYGYNSGTSGAFMIQTTNGGTDWIYTDLTSIVGNVTLYAMSCNEATQTCVALGYNASGNGEWWSLATGGPTWTNVTVPTYANTGVGGVSCSESLCVIATYDTSTDAPIFYQNTGSGWGQVTSFTSSPAQLNTVSCIDDYCLVGGKYNNGVTNLAPLVITTTNGGTLWTTFDFTGTAHMPSEAVFYGSFVSD